MTLKSIETNVSEGLKRLERLKEDIQGTERLLMVDMQAWWAQMLEKNGPRILYELQKSLGHPHSWTAWDIGDIYFYGSTKKTWTGSISAFSGSLTRHVNHAFKLAFMAPEHRFTVSLSFVLDEGSFLTAEHLAKATPTFEFDGL